MFVRITFFEIKTELFPHLWHLCCPLWVFKNGWPVLVFPPHICKSLSLLVLWRHQPGPGPLNPGGLSESRLAGPPWTSVPRPQAKLYPGPCCLKLIVLHRDSEALRTNLSSWTGVTTPQGAHSFVLFAPHWPKKIVFIFLSELFFLRGTFHFIGHFFVLRHFCNLPSYNLQLELSWHHSPAYTKFLCVSLAEHPSFHVVHVFLM